MKQILSRWCVTMSADHKGEPRNVGYSEKHAEYYQDKQSSWINKESNNIFAGKRQKDLFIFAMALGKNRNQLSEIKEKQNNVSVDAMSESQKWALLSIGITQDEDLICLKDEKLIYELAEKYANEGMEILKSHIDMWGPNYPKALEVELKEILGIKP